MMYDVADVLKTINENTLTVTILVLFGWIGGFVQIGEALRLGFTQKVAGQPLGTTMVMLAHDLTFSVNFHHYVHDIGHPMFVMFWCGMVVSNFIEVVMLYQWVKYQNSGIPTPFIWVIVGVFQALTFTIWWWAQSLIDDPLDLVGLTVVQIGAVAFGIPMLLGRRTARGSSRIFVWATLLGPGSLGYLFIPYLAPQIGRHWQFWALVGAAMICAICSVVLYEYLRRTQTSRQPVAEA